MRLAASIPPFAASVFIAASARAQAPAPPAPVPSPIIPATAAPAPAPTPAPTPPTPAPSRILIAPAVAEGVAPGVADAVTRSLYAAAERAGLTVVDPAEADAALGRAGISRVETPADLWRVMHAAKAEIALSAQVKAQAGQFAVELTLSRSDGTGPYFSKGNAAPDALGPTVESLTASVLSPAEIAAPPPTSSLPPAATPAPTQPSPVPSEEPEPAYLRWRVAGQTEAAFGLYEGGFYNHLVGVRLEHRFAKNILLGPYLAYVNVKGRTGREHNVLISAQLDYRLWLTKGGGLQIPARFGTGYLPKNGPWMRVATGLAFGVTDTTEVVLDLIAPALWITRDLTVASLDVAVELGISF